MRAYRPYPRVALAETPAGRRDGWADHLRATVRRDGAYLATLQVTEEPNVASPVLDGGIPDVLPALVEGVVAAAGEVRAAGLDLRVGFNTAPTPDPADPFWPALGALAGPDFHAALGYVGLDLFPDLFRPIPPDLHCRFGILRHDWRQRPAFDTYRALVAELTES